MFAIERLLALTSTDYATSVPKPVNSRSSAFRTECENRFCSQHGIWLPKVFIAWCIAVNCGISWYIAVYCGISWYIAVYCNILWYIVVYCSGTWD